MHACKCSSVPACELLASTTYQHGVCWSVRCCMPPAMAPHQGLSQTTGRGSVLCWGKVYCLSVTGPVDGATRDANGSAAKPGSRSSTMNLSVTRRLPPAVLPHTTDKNNPPPNITDTSCLRLRPQIDRSSAEGFQVALPSGSHVGHPCPQVTISEKLAIADSWLIVFANFQYKQVCFL